MQETDAELVDIPALADWLRTTIPGGDALEVSRLGATTGIGNALFLVKWADRELVLRRPPAERITSSAGNTDRERRVLQALAGTAVRHPKLVASCADPSVIGAPFLLMEQVPGITLAGGYPAALDAPQERHQIGLEAVDALAELNLVDWQAQGLAGFGKPANFLERQVDRWLWQLGTYETREIPGIGKLAAWLRANTPKTQATGILHGDYSLFNVMYASDAPTRLLAIVDWDTATIGDPIVDFGHLLARWDEPGEHTTLGSADLPDRTGLATRAELADRYAAATGWDLSALAFYEAVSLFKLACILEGHYAKAVRDDNGTAARHETAPLGLVQDALTIADGSRR